MATPHRLVDQAADGLADGAKGVIGTVAEGIKGAGEALMRALDAPPQQVLGRQGPHRIIDRVFDGAIDAGKNFSQQGIQSLQIYGEGVSRGLDHPPENVGLPPDINGMAGNIPRPPLPRW